MDQEHSPEQNKFIEHNGFFEAAALFNRDCIEAQAYELLANRYTIPEVYVDIQERRDNARTALMEALTASGHLSEVRLTGNVEQINRQVLSRLLNGWDESLPTHEKSRRFAELCNELFIQQVHKAIESNQLPPNTEVLEISDYPEPLSGTKIGYRHENKKGMVRSTGLRYNNDGTYTRIIEQVSRSDGSWRSTFGFFNGCGVGTTPGEADLVALSTPIIYTRHDYTDGVVDVMRMLDKYAGPGVRYGDRGARLAKHPNYESLRQESERREQEIECYIDDLANLEQQLDEWIETGRISRFERQAIFTEEVDRILSAICTLDPDYAADTFGKRSVQLFDEAAVLAANGRADEASQLIESNSYMKDDVTFCGVTISVEKAQEMGLPVNSFGQLLEKGQESWQWKNGRCRVPNCPSPKPTKIGPCSVCRNCQHQSDKGADLTKLYKSRKVQDNKSKKTLWIQAA